MSLLVWPGSTESKATVMTTSSVPDPGTTASGAGRERTRSLEGPGRMYWVAAQATIWLTAASELTNSPEVQVPTRFARGCASRRSGERSLRDGARPPLVRLRQPRLPFPPGPVNVNMRLGVATGYGNDTFDDTIVSVYGSAFDDVIRGFDPDTFTGYPYEQYIYGGPGGDVITGVSIAAYGVGSVLGDGFGNYDATHTEGNDTIDWSGSEEAHGSGGADSINAFQAFGGSGNDSINAWDASAVQATIPSLL